VRHWLLEVIGLLAALDRALKKIAARTAPWSAY
jgi:hypothetical protein